MDTGNSNLYTFEEYKGICKLIGITREWEFQLSYKMYLKYSSGKESDIKNAILMNYYNEMYFRQGSLN